MRMQVLVLIFVFLSFFKLKLFGQKLDTVQHVSQNNKLILSSIGVGSIWTGGIVSLNSVWYKNYDQSKFHFFNDANEWLQMDKFGHFFSTMHLSEANFRLFSWSGLSNKTSAWIGAGIGLGFQTSLEFLDGKSANWGFSWYDMLANGLGAGCFLTQQTLWEEQKLLLKFSFHPTEFAALRPEVLGSNLPQQFFKDYNGQTYWLSFSPKSFFKDFILPEWFCFSFGYGIDAKLVGDQDFYATNSQSFQAKRRFLLSLDLDARKLPIKNKYVKAILRPIHYLKIPFPALIIDGKKITGNWIYF